MDNKNKNANLSFFEKNIEKGIKEGILKYSEDKSKIIYLGIGKNKEDKKYNIKDPEEKVRASFFVELNLNYNYPKNLIDLEVKVPRRTPNDLADIVVYEDEENKQPDIVIECKKDQITDNEFLQAIEQGFGNGNSLGSKFIGVIAGNTREYFQKEGFKPQEREENIIPDIPRYKKKVLEYRFIKKEGFDLKEVSLTELKEALNKTHRTIWQGGKFDKSDAFNEVSKLIFCKIKDEKDTGDEEKYKFQRAKNEKPEDIFKRVKNIYDQARKKSEDVFIDDFKITPQILSNVVKHIQSINFSKTDIDSKGRALEEFMGPYFRKDNGQYFTPTEIVDFCVEMLDIKNTDYILDTSCGSGGFLLSCLNKVRKWSENKYRSDIFQQKTAWHDFAEKNLYGIEISDKIARVCKMNMIIHDDGHTNIICADGLSKFTKTKEDLKKEVAGQKIYDDFLSEQNKMFDKEKFNKILTNPPFGSIIKSTEKGTNFLDKFKLGKNRKNQKTEILFIERCFEFLKPNGKMGIVLPDGILTNSSLQYVRDYIMERFQILAIVSIPQFAFTNSGAGVKSSLVFLRKKESENEKLGRYKIFMAIAKRIGYDATGRKDKENDLNSILENFRKLNN